MHGVCGMWYEYCHIPACVIIYDNVNIICTQYKSMQVSAVQVVMRMASVIKPLSSEPSLH